MSKKGVSKMKKKGFTLIELMIVVAIIGILSAVAIPRFASMIQKANEAACKGNLGAIKSAVSLYYGDQEGLYPQEDFDVTNSAFLPTYIADMPTCKPGDGTSSAATLTQTDGSVPIVATAAGGWWYNMGSTNPGGTYAGDVRVNSTATDTKNVYLSAW
ncbi:MAG: type II secretion system protein [bacterium]